MAVMDRLRLSAELNPRAAPPRWSQTRRYERRSRSRESDPMIEDCANLSQSRGGAVIMLEQSAEALAALDCASRGNVIVGASRAERLVVLGLVRPFTVIIIDKLAD